MGDSQRGPIGPKPRRIPTQRPGREGGKRDENRRRRVRELCACALELMLEKGIESVTVDEIVSAAGVAKGSFYRYFKGKPELVDTLFQTVHGRIRGALSGAADAISAADSEPALMMAYVGIGRDLEHTLTDFPGEILLYLQECRAPRTPARRPVRAMADEIGAGAVRLTEAAKAKGLLTGTASVVSALAVVGATEQLLFMALSGGELGMAPRMAALSLINMVMSGLKP